MKIKLFLLPILAMTTLAGCDNGSGTGGGTGGGGGGEHIHEFSAEWKHDESKHWHEATCGHDVRGDEGVHVYDPTTGDCICGMHEHKYSKEWSHNDWEHFHEPSCIHKELDRIDKAEHSYGPDGYCTVCGYGDGIVTFVAGKEPYCPTNIKFEEHISNDVSVPMTNYFEKIGNDVLYKHGNGSEAAFFRFVRKDVYEYFNYSGNEWVRLGFTTSKTVFSHTSLSILWGYAVEGSRFNKTNPVRTGQTKMCNGVPCQVYKDTSGLIPVEYWVFESYNDVNYNLVYKQIEGTNQLKSVTELSNFSESITEFSMEVPLL